MNEKALLFEILEKFFPLIELSKRLQLSVYYNLFNKYNTAIELK